MQPVLIPSAGPTLPSEQRLSERLAVGLPCTIDGQQAQTNDLSATGLSFESKTCHAVGDVIQMTVRYGLDGHNVLLPCDVEVVRMEPEGDHFNIGARLIRPFFESEA